MKSSSESSTDLQLRLGGEGPRVAVGDLIGNIRIIEVLGAGGMGKVYVGFDETLQRRVALKAIGWRHRLRPEARARFLREARILSQLEHPNICRIYDYLTHGDSDLLVLELIDGPTLSQAVADGLGFQRKLEIAGKIAEVLAAAHSEGIIHRDLKPDNVMLTRAGEVKVLDFGLARAVEAETGEGDPPLRNLWAKMELPADSHDRTLTSPGGTPAGSAEGNRASPFPLALHTEAGSILGTPLYMSPEQARGEAVTTASDMYSLGLLLKTLFTGKSPYPRELDAAQLLARVRRGETRPMTGVDRDVAALVEQLESAAPAARPTAVAALERLRWIHDKPRRRLRRLIAAAVVAAIFLAGLKYTFDLRRERAIAVEARNEADLRRGQAESLIGFMLGDLREKLAPVGRLELLDDVGEQAMEYFASVPEDELTDDELLSRSKALYQIGEVRITQGDLPAAVEPLRESLALAKELSARDPGDSERLFGVGQSHYWAGYVYWFQGELHDALAEYKSYLEVAEKLIEIDSHNPDWQLEVAYALTNVAAVYERLGRLEEALAAVRRSNGIKQELVAADPANLDRARSLAGGLSWLGSILWSANRAEESLIALRAEAEIRRRILEQAPRSPISVYDLAISNELIGNICLATGDVECALARQRQAEERLAAIVRLDESNSSWQRELAVSRRLLGDALLEVGQLGDARDHFLGARRILERLVESDPTSADWRRELARVYDGLARVQLARGENDALPFTRSALDSLETLDVEDMRTRRVLAETHLLAGRAQQKIGKAGEARKAWARALEILDADSEAVPGFQTLDYRAQAMLYLGRDDEARSIVEYLVNSGYARPSFLALCRSRGLLPPES